MGLGPSKEKIRRILERSITNPNMSEQKNLKIEYKYKQTDSMEVEEAPSSGPSTESSENTENDSFTFSQEVTQVLINPKLDVKNTKKFPYIAIGTISVKFPISEDTYEYTCFLIDTNVVVTLASNINDKNKGGKAKSIVTTFSEEKVKWENIRIQGEDKKDKGKKDNKGNDETLEGINLSSKLAVILYDDNIGSEWIGVEGGKKSDFDGRDIYAVFSLGFKGGETTTEDDNG